MLTFLRKRLDEPNTTAETDAFISRNQPIKYHVIFLERFQRSSHQRRLERRVQGHPPHSGYSDFDSTFFDLVPAAAGSRQTSSKSTASAKLSTDAKNPGGIVYPPMPSLTGERNARGLSTESWFDPSSMPQIEQAAQRVSSSDFIGQYVLKEELAVPKNATRATGAKRKRSGDSEELEAEAAAAAPSKKRSARSARARTTKRARINSIPDTLEDAVKEPGPNDVGMGRGGKANNHIGKTSASGPWPRSSSRNTSAFRRKRRPTLASA